MKKIFFICKLKKFLFIFVCLFFFQTASFGQNLLPITNSIYWSTPTMIKSGGFYYTFLMNPGIGIRRSPNLTDWGFIGTVIPGDGSQDPAWWTQEVPNYGVWAPDISYFNGRYHLYYSISTPGSQRSAIGLFTTTSLENPNWVDRGMVLKSEQGDLWNAIDPNIILVNGQPYMSWGSYWNGIYIRQIDLHTGMFAAGTSPTHLAKRTPSAGGIEAPVIVFKDGFYYLFVSFDEGANYNVRVGRSLSVTGPYVDANDIDMLNGGGTPVMSSFGDYVGVGHNSILEDNGKYYISCEFYYASRDLTRYGLISELAWPGGWPVGANNAHFSQPVANGIYKIEPKHSNYKALDVSGCSHANAANIQQWASNGADCQRWNIEWQGDGFYKITAVHSGMALDNAGGSYSNGGNIHQWPWVDFEFNMYWRIDDLGDGSYKFVNRTSGRVMEVSGMSPSNGANVQQWEYNGADNQKWHVVRDGGMITDGKYKISASHSGKYIDVDAISQNNGANIHQWDYFGTPNQNWIVTNIGGGYYKILASHSNKSLEVGGWSMNNGGNIIQWQYYGNNSNQQWKILDVGGGLYEIVNRNSGLCLDVHIGGSSQGQSNGDNIQQYQCNGNSNQRWRFEWIH